MLRQYRIILSADTASEVPQPETVEWFMPILQNQKPGTELQRALAIRAENRYNSNCYLSQ